MSSTRMRRRRRDERGAIAIMVALSMIALVVAAALVTDFGVVRLDRQQNKLATDDAAMAGLRAAGNEDDGQFYNSLGVCAAVDFLKANRPSLGGLPPCTPDPTHVCTPGDTSADYFADITSGNHRYKVWVKAPYLVNDATVDGGAFPEESLGSLSSDVGDTTKGGCDQIGVIIQQSTVPVLGRIVTNGQPLVYRVRSVGRVKISPGDKPPALLLLERNACSVLTVGSGGSPSRIAVKGSGETPATIHSDSTATGADCGSGPNQQLIQGKQADGIVAYGSTTGLSGMITAVAADDGRPANILYDSLSNVYSTTGVYPSVTDTIPVSPRKLVSRRPVDRRYLPGVTNSVLTAYSQWLLNHSSPTGYTRFGCPTAANMTTMAGMTAANSVYIDCPNPPGITLDGSIGAGTIYFHGFIKNGKLAMPNATKVYIDNTDNSGARINASALSLGNNNTFCVRATTANCVASTPAVGQCSNTPTGSFTAKAQVVIRRGQMDSQSGGLLRLCNTTVILEGGQLGSGTAAAPGGCLPTSWGTPPTVTPCVGASDPAGNSFIGLSGATDWTAPNQFDDMAAAPYFLTTDALKQPFWDGGEDLALWDETYGVDPKFKMAGGGALHVSGVFMVPNASPFTITGSGAQDLTNAQYITRKFAVDGGATLTMGVDRFNAVGPPTLDPFALVR